MNMKRNIITVGVLLFFSAVLWNCSESSDKNPEKGLTLEESLKEKTVSLSTAVNEITNSKGFEIITMNDPNAIKNGDGEGNEDYRNTNITLANIQGDYAFNPDENTEGSRAKFGMPSVFAKTKDTTLFILRLPKEKAGNPWNLYMTEEGDDELNNDFVITTTDYNYSVNLTDGFQFSNMVNSSIAVEGEPAGELHVNWSITPNQNYEYESEFSFTDEYSVGIEFEYGEVIEYSYNLKNGEEVLFAEEIEFTRGEGEERGSFEYTLSIGIIQITKNSDSNKYIVYRAGILEEDAIIEVINDDATSTNSDQVFCRKGLDLKITFNDGSVIVLSEQLGEGTLNKMNEIFSSMYDMYFVEHIVNKVARQVYTTNRRTNN